jgi:hypothetical protein
MIKNIATTFFLFFSNLLYMYTIVNIYIYVYYEKKNCRHSNSALFYPLFFVCESYEWMWATRVITNARLFLGEIIDLLPYNVLVPRWGFFDGSTTNVRNPVMSCQLIFLNLVLFIYFNFFLDEKRHVADLYLVDWGIIPQKFDNFLIIIIIREKYELNFIVYSRSWVKNEMKGLSPYSGWSSWIDLDDKNKSEKPSVHHHYYFNKK